MDEFGVLTQSYGIKPQGKSAPMASLKQPSKPHNNNNHNFGNSISFDSNRSSFDFDSMFKNSNDSGLRTGSFDDLFGGLKSSGSVDYDNNSNDDIFGSFGLKKSDPIDDLMFGFGGSSRSNNNARNLKPSRLQHPSFSNLSSSQAEDPFIVLESTSTATGMLDPLEQLSQLNNSRGTSHGSSTSGKDDETDPFDVFVKSVPVKGNLSRPTSASPPSRSPPKPVKIPPPSMSPPPKPVKLQHVDRAKHSIVSSIDELEDFAKGRVQNNADEHPGIRLSKKEVESSAAATFTATRERQSVPGARYKENANLSHGRSEEDIESFFSMDSRPNSASRSGAPKNKEAEDASRGNQHKSVDDLESFFSMGARSSSAPRSRTTNLDTAFDTHFQKGGRPEMAPKASFRTSSNNKKPPPVTNIFDDFSGIFGEDDISGEFREIEGESEERRRARLGRHQRTQDRVAQAVADMNKRELQTNREQEERQRVAEILDGKIKHWAWGKEGNLRALLSTMQNVLWTDCGWQPVSLTDMITSVSVKKVYRKATLFVHPDKVQQKGANLEQKYIAEKVFDILKEAWNKFNKEELS